ncbi:MAG: T9SS type A sorting domain-containing protein [Bacteroidia bacterium]|nr:T9SS type A sorting domain-containing protein [Bacteroidia bacterium]
MRILTVILLFIGGFLQAQVSLSSEKLSFGDVFTTSDKEMGVDVTNNSGSDLTVTKIKIYNTDFTYTIGSTTINNNSSQKIRVTFKPRHNVIYNSELIVVLSDGSEYRIDLVGNGKYADTYYSATFNKSYQDLKNELKSIISAGYTNLGYSGARDKMYGDIDNVGGKITCVYTGRQATFNTRAGANSNSFNCEHTWPQSKFNSNEPERADIHHLFPTDVNANSRRGSYPFGVVSSASWSEGGSKLGGGKFEPRNEQKGATARAMLYFAIRYQDYENFIDSQEDLLKQWHSTYVPSAFEIIRNNKIFSYQKNRNPFVDHPEFIERMNKIGSTDTKPIIKSAEPADSVKNFGSVPYQKQRAVYLVNTGNFDIGQITSVSLTNGTAVSINSHSADADAGEVIEVLLDFDKTSTGSHKDTLVIDLQSQIGETFRIPLQFLMTSSIKQSELNKLRSFYNQSNKTIVLKNIPAHAKSVEVWNTQGQRILLNDISLSFTDIPFGGQSNGVYFVVIKTIEEVYTSKIIVY